MEENKSKTWRDYHWIAIAWLMAIGLTAWIGFTVWAGLPGHLAGSKPVASTNAENKPVASPIPFSVVVKPTVVVEVNSAGEIVGKKIYAEHVKVDEESWMKALEPALQKAVQDASKNEIDGIKDRVGDVWSAVQGIGLISAVVGVLITVMVLYFSFQNSETINSTRDLIAKDARNGMPDFLNTLLLDKDCKIIKTVLETKPEGESSLIEKIVSAILSNTKNKILQSALTYKPEGENSVVVQVVDEILKDGKQDYIHGVLRKYITGVYADDFIESIKQKIDAKNTGQRDTIPEGEGLSQDPGGNYLDEAILKNLGTICDSSAWTAIIDKDRRAEFRNLKESILKADKSKKETIDKMLENAVNNLAAWGADRGRNETFRRFVKSITEILNQES